MLRKLFIICLVVACASPTLWAKNLPNALTDTAFWKMISDFSEPGAYFINGNFVSNEDDYQAVLPALAKTVTPGGVYIGVGPEQNFTYISVAQPGISFIVDIRRDNMLGHLLYKALFELSSNRIDFVSRLFSLQPVAGLNDESSIESIFEAYEIAPYDPSLYDANLAAVYDQLIRGHGFQLSDQDKTVIAQALSYFALGPRRFWTTPNATYSRLMESSDRDGHNWSYLASEDNFRRIQDYQKRNLIVPLVGDFAGPKTIRAIGQYAHEHSAIVNVFYTSNVDEYLFKDRKHDTFYSNVSTLPLDSSSTMIRVVAGPGGGFDGTYKIAPGKMWAAMLCPMADLVKAFQTGEIRTRTHVNRLSRQ